jgi:hypothetical protein
VSSRGNEDETDEDLDEEAKSSIFKETRSSLLTILDQETTLKTPFHTKTISWESQKIKVKIKA